MNEKYKQFKEECTQEIEVMGNDQELKSLTQEWVMKANALKYSYHFEWMGRPIIQYPQDILAMQELIWEIKPDLIIETGIAHGGSLIFSASQLAMLDYAAAQENGETLDPNKPSRKVLGVDIDIRSHNEEAIQKHPLSSSIDMIQGSSVDELIVQQVREYASGFEKILVFLDSNHTHDHVLAELELYSPLVTIGSYCVVFDSIVEDLPAGTFDNRPWDKGNNPKTAIWEFLKTNNEFQIDKRIDNKLLISVAPHGYLKRVD